MPKIISVNNVTEGMVLSEPIVNKFGQVLLGADIVLLKKHINFFKMWNIELVTIQSDDEEEDTINDDDYESAKSNLFNRILWKPRNKNEEELIELGIVFEFKKLNK